MSAAASVASRLRRVTVPKPPPPVPNSPLSLGSIYRPDRALSPNRYAPPIHRVLKVPPVPHPAATYARWEAPAIGAKTNPLPRYMFRPHTGATVPGIRGLPK